jgi:hypothetical protein
MYYLKLYPEMDLNHHGNLMDPQKLIIFPSLYWFWPDICCENPCYKK